MSAEEKRGQTDESLRREREKVDDTIGQTFGALEQLTDAVVEKARGRTDAVLAAARAREDQHNARTPTRSAGMLARSRAQEDALLHRERSEADELLRVERASHRLHLSTLRRVTDADLYEERSRADDELATRDDFLGIVSHDLRNMLGSVMGFAMLIGRIDVQKRPDMVRLSAQRIQRSVGRMSQLVGDLVDVASIEAGALALHSELGDPAGLVREAVDTFQTLAEGAEVTLAAEVIPPLPQVAFDPARIFQVLTNLLSNAIKFTPPNGQIVLRVEQIDDELRFEVRDTGAGIPTDKLETIFERFQQGDSHDRRGVGLGLYISSCIIRGHHGRIWAESEPGEGSVFYFTLPIRPH